MKKLSKSALIITVVTALLFAVAATALAVSWSESGTFSGHAYSGDYYAAMSLVGKSVSAKLEVSNYEGIIEYEGRARISGYCVNDKGESVGDINESGEPENIYSAYLDFDANNSSAVAVRCYYTFYGFYVIDHSIRLN